MREVPADILVRARRLRQENYSWKRIAKHLRFPLHPLQMKLDPTYRARKLAEQANTRTPLADFDYTMMLPKEDGITRDPEYDPKRDGPREWASRQAELLGEPCRGRSALDKARASK
jgi:hypothetical protein